MLQRLFRRRNAYADTARSLYDTAVRQARRGEFYRDHGVPDTLDGRFELISLHVFLILYRLNREREGDAATAQALSQAVFDAMFEDMDRSLREMGAGDLGVGPRVKKMGQAFYGRIAAYEEGLASRDGALVRAVRRNVYGTVDEPGAGSVAAIAGYLRMQAETLDAQALKDIAAGHIAFDAPPGEVR